MSTVSRSLIRYAGGVVLLVLLPHVLREIVGRGITTWVETGTSPWWLPVFGSAGATGTRYIQAIDLLSLVVVPALIFALGYRYGVSRSNAATET